MVRGSAALLAGAAPLVLAPSLPAAGAGLAAALGALATALCALSVLGGRDDPIGLVPFAAGAVLLAIALSAGGVGAAATPVEALFAAAAGLLFAWSFALPAALVAVPLLVAGLDVAAVVAAGDGAVVRGGGPGDLLTLELPRWGGGGAAAQLGLLDATFLALFAAWALRFDLRPRLAIVLMVLGLTGAATLSVAVERTVPALPLLAAGFLLAAPDRLTRIVREP